ncbi:hypothetical protein L1987_53468 [Smallanthus sonchifolius]|uniref:Uncharacterized protein n=1 Tax=Smallanthus sonchifolius TaxID=185202 RepID=A0ACB9EWC9_9ASTR|nr:hypothetical protein L1987_53468 [Smallanthus sonchifolius]
MKTGGESNGDDFRSTPLSSLRSKQIIAYSYHSRSYLHHQQSFGNDQRKYGLLTRYMKTVWGARGYVFYRLQ